MDRMLSLKEKLSFDANQRSRYSGIVYRFLN